MNTPSTLYLNQNQEKRKTEGSQKQKFKLIQKSNGLQDVQQKQQPNKNGNKTGNFYVTSDEYQLNDAHQQQKHQQNINDKNRSSSIRMQSNNVNEIKTTKNEFKNTQQEQQKTKENQIFEDFKQHDFDVIDNLKNNEYQILLIFNDILFYYNKNQQDIKNPQQSQEYQYRIRGKLYQTSYDQNQNPKFIIQKGEFLVDLNNKLFVLDGQGIEYQGKSNQIKNNGEYKKGVYLQRIPSSQNRSEYKSYSVEPKRIRILEIIDGQAIPINNYNNKNEKKSIWCKYNQQFSQNDLMILYYSMWMNSSMIDCYVLYLNTKSQKEYFQLKQEKRQQVKRIYFVTSSLITNFGQVHNNEQAVELFQQHFLELQEINYEIQTIYSKIGFPINKQKHWYFLLFDLKLNNVEIFNSLPSNIESHKPLIQILSDLLMIKNPQISKNQNSGQQKDGYSCGYHVCQFMKTCQEAQFSNQSNYCYNEKEMKKILKNLIKDGHNQINNY